MTSKKKYLFNFMVLCMVLIGIFLIPQTTRANGNDFVIEDGVLTKYTGSGGDVVIPNTVTKIGDYAFYNCSNLTDVILPNGVTEIGGSAFQGCSNLENVTIPNSVTEIGMSAFFGTPWLDKKRNECTDHLVIVNNILIEGKTATGSVSIPNGVVKIGDAAFIDCTNLTSISIPDSVTEIGKMAFMYNNLTDVKLSNNLQKINSSAFYCCKNLSNIKLPESLTEIQYGAFGDCISLTNVEIPKGVIEIGEYAFSRCNNLKGIVFTENVKSIGKGAIRGCDSLESVTILNKETNLLQEEPQGLSNIFGSETGYDSQGWSFKNPVIVKGYSGSTAEEMVTKIKQCLPSNEQENIIFEALDGTGNTGTAISTPTPTTGTKPNNTVKPSGTAIPSPTSSTVTKPDNTMTPQIKELYREKILSEYSHFAREVAFMDITGDGIEDCMFRDGGYADVWSYSNGSIKKIWADYGCVDMYYSQDNITKFVYEKQYDFEDSNIEKKEFYCKLQDDKQEILCEKIQYTNYSTEFFVQGKKVNKETFNNYVDTFGDGSLVPYESYLSIGKHLGMSLGDTKITLKMGEKYTFGLILDDRTPKWTSSNTKIATISKKGTVTPKKAGTCTITAQIGTEKATCKLTVSKKVNKEAVKKLCNEFTDFCLEYQHLMRNNTSVWKKSSKLTFDFSKNKNRKIAIMYNMNCALGEKQSTVSKRLFGKTTSKVNNVFSGEWADLIPKMKVQKITSKGNGNYQIDATTYYYDWVTKKNKKVGTATFSVSANSNSSYGYVVKKLTLKKK